MTEAQSIIGRSVFLTSTDTVTGFVSQNAEKLDNIKNRIGGKHYIVTLPSLRALCKCTRTPQLHKNRVRRSKQTTFIFPNSRSFRVIHASAHLLLIERFGWAYSTSANRSGKPYDLRFAKDAADIIVHPIRTGLKPSPIIMLGSKRTKRIR